MSNEDESKALFETMSDTETDTAAAATGDNDVTALDLAREKAEARRKRILEKANKRMNYVNGESTQDEEEKKTSVSNAARIRAARQRRYGKKNATSLKKAEPESIIATDAMTSTEDKVSGGNNETESTQVDTIAVYATATPNESSSTKDVVSAANKTTETDETTSEEAKGEAKSDEKANIPFDEPAETSKQQDSEPSEASTKGNSAAKSKTSVKKKKYLGVARIRRKMIAKKKLEENASNDEHAAESSNSNASSKLVGRKTVQSVPIYMHMFVVVLLFFAGFDVGMQQFHTNVRVRMQIAILEYGFPFIHRKPWKSLDASEPYDDNGLDDKFLLQQLEWKQRTSSSSFSINLHDDFSEIEQEYVPDIDPLFRVDLDELTNGRGFLDKTAKGAIAVHRLLLWMFYYGPISIVTLIFSIPSALIRTPPSLFISAIILRQVLGKIILGACIPDSSGEGDSDGKKQNNIEILSMAKNFIKNFFATTFPSLVTMYDVYVHLKADMYVIICGVFLGMAWTHLNATYDAPQTIVNDVADGNYEL